MIKALKARCFIPDIFFSLLTVYPNTCDNIFLQDLPNNYRRLGGTKIADDIDYDACQNRCKTNPHCQAVDWNISMRLVIFVLKLIYLDNPYLYKEAVGIRRSLV